MLSDMRDPGDLYRDEPAVYRICLSGVLDASWSDMLAGMALASDETGSHRGITTLSGCVADQAALMGVLNLVYTLGMTVLLVECEGAATLIGANAPDAR
ncbi:MAG: hypothetical protein IPK16_28305 [Anaerolineales bacterium]|nr:hypothetical protein [Anaerolineales bacterium]